MGIGHGAWIERTIVDKNARIGDDVRITPDGKPADFDGPNYYIRDGIVIIPKNAVMHERHRDLTYIWGPCLPRARPASSSSPASAPASAPSAAPSRTSPPPTSAPSPARAALDRCGVEPAAVDHVVFGNVLQTSADAIYLARHVGLRAGLPIETPARHREPALRLGLRGGRPGGAADPAGRVARWCSPAAPSR